MSNARVRRTEAKRSPSSRSSSLRVMASSFALSRRFCWSSRRTSCCTDCSRTSCVDSSAERRDSRTTRSSTSGANDSGAGNAASVRSRSSRTSADSVNCFQQFISITEFDRQAIGKDVSQLRTGSLPEGLGMRRPLPRLVRPVLCSGRLGPPTPVSSTSGAVRANSGNRHCAL